MGYSFTDVKALNEYLLTKSYISGCQASTDDLAVFNALNKKEPSADAFPNAARWYSHIAALIGMSFPGKAEGVTLPGGNRGGGEGGGKKAEKKKAVKKESEKPKEKTPEELKKEEEAAAKKAREKLLAKVIKEGGKKGVEIEGAADLGGLEFFCTTIDSPEGDVELLQLAMDSMNAEPDPTGEERKGGAKNVGTMIFSAGLKDLAICAYVPEAQRHRMTAEGWMEHVLANEGVVGAVKKGAKEGECWGIAPGAPECDPPRFPLKQKDAAMAAAFAYLRSKDCFPEDESEGEDVSYAEDFEW